MVRLKQIGNLLFVKLEGEIDHLYTESIKNCIDNKINEKNLYNLVFDFNKVTFIDSSAIGLILGRYKKVNKKNGILCFTNVNQRIEYILKISGVLNICKIYKSNKDVLKVFKEV